jgi:hypothetical protein
VRKRNRVFTGHPKFTQVSERNVLQAGANDFPKLERCHDLVTRKKGDSKAIRIGSKGLRSFWAQRIAWHLICDRKGDGGLHHDHVENEN